MTYVMQAYAIKGICMSLRLASHLAACLSRGRAVARASAIRLHSASTLLTWIFAILCSSVAGLPAPAMSAEQEFRVIHAEFELGGAEGRSERSGPDYYLNGGETHGLQQAMLLDVYRGTRLLDPYTGRNHTIRILVGQLQVLRVYKETAIARAHALEAVTTSPLLTYQAVMVGDYAVPRTVPASHPPTMSLPSSVLFAFGRWELKAEAREVITAAYHLLHKSPDQDLVIEGHTCDIGKEEDNRLLSLKRAQSVARFLTQTLTVPENRLHIQGFGEAIPVASNSTEEGRNKNRRVDFRLMPRNAPSLPLASSMADKNPREQ